MSTASMQVHRWTRQQYEQMVLAGIFHPAERLELIEGEIFDMTPQSSLHATTVCLVEDTLRSLYREGYYVRVQMPLAIDGDSEPEPDIAVVTGRPRDYRNAHPHTAVLIVEVADHSLSYDRGQKKTVYARNKIPEYWIVNLAENSLEVYRNPTQDSYQFQMILHPPDLVSPLTQPQVAIAVADLLP